MATFLNTYSGCVMTRSDWTGDILCRAPGPDCDCDMSRRDESIRVYARWYGGTNYSGPAELEVFESVEDAAIECENRMKSDPFEHRFEFVDIEPVRVRTPCVDEHSRMEIYLARLSEFDDAMPDLVLVYDADEDRFRSESLVREEV